MSTQIPAVAPAYNRGGAWTGTWGTNPHALNSGDCDGGLVYSPAAPGLPVSAHSVLDVVPQLAGQSAAAALRETAEVAQTADDLGYRRFWLAEHHGVRGTGSASPAVLAAILAARTDRIRLGSGAVLLTNHQPLVVAEQFAALAAAYPSRIDLGVAKSPSAPPSTAAALGWTDKAWDSFPQRLDELCRFLRDGLPGRAPVGDVRLALAGLPPPVFVLADSPAGAQVAAVRGLPVFLSHHSASAATLAAAAAYRDSFEPTAPTGKPYVGVTVGVVAADTDEEAVSRLAEYVRVKGRLKTASNRATPAELMHLLEPPITNRERSRAERLLDDPGYVVGSRSGVASGLATVAATTGADEIMLVPLAFDSLVRSAILRTIASGLTRAIRTIPRHAPHFVATA
ncbi:MULTISPECIES: MsnO8 family LLM class oxidoreductase [Kribbella]|uniref:MsnO8 family LLM class oxidoreductase n=1 Tax=Kribbella TaxID=182639 RepID=UPI001F54020F|nr:MULTISPECIES: MsnO8 family LLM class oxidoreductase [Kribbella]